MSMSQENKDLWAAMKATADICCRQEARKAAQKAQESTKPTPAAITPRVIYL